MSEKDKEFKWNQFYYVFCISIGHLLDGLVLAFPSPGLPSMKESDSSLQISELEQSLIVSLSGFGAMLGSLIAGTLMRKFGRRGSSLYFTCTFYLIGFLNIAFAQCIYMVYLGRFFGGMGLGLTLSIPTVYIMEISSLHLRGIHGSLPNLMVQSGILLTYICGKYLSWRLLAFGGAVLCFPFLIGLLWIIPESPVYLAATGNMKHAERILFQLNQNSNIYFFKNLLESSSNQKLDWKELLEKMKDSSVYKPFFCGLIIMLVFQATAYPLIISYSFKLLQDINVQVNSHDMNMTIGAVVVLSSLISMILAKIMPRKNLLIISELGIFLSLFTLGALLYMMQRNDYNNFFPPLITILIYWIFIFFFVIGIGSVSWIVIAEILPSSLQSSLYPIIIAFFWLFNMISVQVFNFAIVTIQSYGTFIFYGILSFLGFFFIVFRVPETRNKSEKEIADFFNC